MRHFLLTLIVVPSIISTAWANNASMVCRYAFARNSKISDAEYSSQPEVKLNKTYFEGHSFARTDREREVMSEHVLGAKFLTPEFLKGKKVLDAGCGEFGLYVRYLRKNGIDAYGIDLKVDSQGGDYLFDADMTKTEFLDNSFDVTLSTYSLPTYATWPAFEGIGAETFRRALHELIRVTKVDGLILISPIDKSFLKKLDRNYFFSFDSERNGFKKLMTGIQNVEVISLTEHPHGINKDDVSLVLRKLR